MLAMGKGLSLWGLVVLNNWGSYLDSIKRKV